MKKVGRIIVSLCVVALFAAGGLYGTGYILSVQGSSSSDGDEAGRDPVRVGVAKPEVRQIEDDLTAVGTLVPVRAVDLVPTVPGRVTEVPVDSGRRVEAGEVIAQLDDRSERAALAGAEATLSEARQEVRRVEELADRNTAAEARLEEARAAYQRADASAMRARADLEDRAIRAPFAGTLGLIDLERGAYVSASTSVARLSDLSAVEVRTSLPERYFDQVAPGQTVVVTTPAYPTLTFKGRVTVRSSEVNLGSRTFDVRAEIDNPDRRLVGGMFANTRIILGTSEGLAIPDDAIISEGLTTFVYEVADGTAHRTEIEVGSSLGPLTEVADGLPRDTQVVVAGWDRLSDGMPVEIDGEFAEEGLE